MRRANVLKRTISFIIVLSFLLITLFGFFSVAYAKTTTFTYFVTMDSKVAASYTSYAQIAAYQMLMKKFNVKLDFRHPPSASTAAQDQFNLMVASRQLTDIIEWNWLENYPGGPTKAMQDKVIIRLNEYIDKYAPNFKRYLEKNPEVKRMITTDDGDIYCFPVLREDKVNLFYYGPQVRRDWLEKLGLSAPETVDDWYKMLKAFKTKDPNGNGKADERPFSMIRSGTTPLGVFDYSSFLVGAWGIKTDFYQEKGKVKYGPLQPQFKEFVATLQKWWKEGLIDQDILTMNTTAIKANVQNNIIGSYVGIMGGDMGFFLNLLYGKGTSFDLMGVKNPVLKKGDPIELGQAEFLYARRGAAITTACKDIPLAVKMLDWRYSKEGYLAFNFGVEGKSYIMKNGKPYYTDEILKHPKLDAATSLARYACASISGPFVQTKEWVLQVNTMWPQQKEALANWSLAKNDKILPPFISYTEAESKRIASIMNNVNTYYSEIFLKMMTGKFTNIDSFVKTLKKMQIDEAIKINQAAYERYLKRK